MLPKPEKDAFVQEIKKSLFQTMKEKNRKEKVSILKARFSPICSPYFDLVKENQNPENQNRRATIFTEGGLWKNGFGIKKGVYFEDEFRADLNFNDFGSKVKMAERSKAKSAKRSVKSHKFK